MRFPLAAAMFAAAVALSGCGHDPLIHGPFLIGANPPDQYPPNCRPGSIISQESKNGWDRCMAAGYVVHQQPVMLTPLPPAPAVYVAPSVRVTSNRSAW